MRMRFAILPLLLLLTAAPAVHAEEEFDFAFPQFMDVLCHVLAAEDIPAAMAEYGPVTEDEFEETVFFHHAWTLVLDEFTLVYDVSQEREEDGSVFSEDYFIEARVEDPGAAPLFHDLRQAHGWLRELGQLTLDGEDQAEFTAEPFPGEENMAPLWWRIRAFCGSGAGDVGPCRMIRFFWNQDTADHNGAFCR